MVLLPLIRFAAPAPAREEGYFLCTTGMSDNEYHRAAMTTMHFAVMLVHLSVLSLPIDLYL